MTPIFTTVMVVEAIIFIFEWLLYERTPVMIAAMALKLVAVLLSACSVYQFHRIRIGNDPSRDSLNLIIIYATIVLSLSWAVANTAVTQMITGDITVYVLVLFGIAAVVQMPPLHAMVIYCLFYLFFIAAIFLVQDNTRVVTWHIINGGILNVIAWLISRRMYRYRLEIYKDKIIISQKNKELFDKAQPDGLTGLFNHQAIHGHLDNALSFAAGNRQDLSIALIDIDHFKSVNDTYCQQTGDIIVKSVADTIRQSVREMDITGRYGDDESTLIEKLEHSPWSHVGMVVKLPDDDQPLFWESTTLTNLADDLFHDHMQGPKVVDLHQRMKQYGRDLKPYVPARFAYRKLDVAHTEAMIDSLSKMFTKDHGLPDPSEWKMIVEVAESRLLNIRSRLSTFFCSELIADSYVKMGLLPADRAVNAYIPKDFTSAGHLPLLKGQLESEILIEL